ncbi:MAG TPA: copper homeostasis protein CutC [Atopostipes sp.]|nr:copper homeostasis protein CutC [Atopostipes sp.]
MLLEFCAENFTKVPEAIKRGAERIELCDNLQEGGTTPSYAVIEQTVKYTKQHDAKVVVMVRPRGGNFVYSNLEHEMMKKDLEHIKALGADGVVFGSLTEDHLIERKQTKALIDLSGELETTFHMAFDQIPKEKQKEELDWLIQQGVTRILTHGGLGGTVFDHADWLNELITYADGRIEILIGGGVTHENLEDVSNAIPNDQYHGTKIVNFDH